MRQDIFTECQKRISASYQDGILSKAKANELYADLQTKIEQKRKLDLDFAVGKIEPKLYNEWDASIRRDVVRISEQIDEIMIRRMKKRKQKGYFLLGGIVAAGCLIYAAFAVPQYLHAQRTIAGIPEPIQELLSESEENQKTIHWNDCEIRLNYLASYDIKGLVVELDDYDNKIGGSDTFDRAIPRDLSLAWGKAAEYKTSFRWSHGGRALKQEYDYDVLRELHLSEHDIVASASNNHIMTDDKELYKKLKRVRRGDYIEMKGYLVAATIIDEKNGDQYDIRSSLTRDDYSTSVLDQKTSCEVMYITSLEWLD